MVDERPRTPTESSEAVRVQLGSPPDEIYARAGLIASEHSLLGLGAGTLISTTLAVLVQGSAAAGLVLPALAASSGLLACGVGVAFVGRYLGLGGSSRRPAALPLTFRPVVALGAVASVLGWLAVALVSRGSAAGPPSYPGALDSTGFAVMAVASLGAALPLLAALGLRAIAAVDGGAPMPVAQLFQATGHSMLGGLGLLVLIAFASGAMGLELKIAMGAAVTAACAHTLLWSAWLLRGSRRRMDRMRKAGLRVAMLERGHSLAAATTVVGLVAPGLVVMADLLLGRDTGLVIACAVLAVSNHAMRYAWVLLALRRGGD
ncbi:MAG: hypothetical protein ACOYOB_18470 [Myxococcota bacterium]